MPTILREGPYRFYFVSADRDEPPHIHVRRDDGLAKFWLTPEVVLQGSSNFGRSEVRRIQAIVENNQSMFVRRSDGYFNR